ncbi:MAG: histidine kinase dimerization/phospho-acceptor domain-containing protein, partial [Terriglobales bacterium]
MRLKSLRGRLLVGVIGAQLLLAVGLVWAGLAFTRRQLGNAFDAALQGRARALGALVRYPERGPGLLFDTTLVAPAPDAVHPWFYEVFGPGRSRITSTFPPALALPVPAGEEHFWDFRYRGTRYRGIVLTHLPVLDTEEQMPSPLPQLSVYYAAPTAAMQHETAVAGAAIAAVSLVLLALTSWLAAWMVRRELMPLHQLAAQAAAISPRHGSFTPPARAAVEELRPLFAALERMRARLQAAHRQQLAFLADTAHHLKTPVAIIKSTQQTLLQRPREAGAYREAAEATLQDTERLEQLLQRMLHLARLDATEDGQAA